MLCACHSLHQNLYAWIRNRFARRLEFQVIPLKRDLDACSRLMRWPGLSPAGGDMNRSSAPLAGLRTAAGHSGADIPDPEHGSGILKRKPGAKMGIRNMLSHRPGQTRRR